MKRSARVPIGQRSSRRPRGRSASGLDRVELFTVGHSTRSFDEFLRLIRTHGVQRVVDIRTIPRSRHNPQFNRETFSKRLRARRIAYRHLAALGGLRRAKPESINKAWRNASFRGYADYMQTPEFEAGLERLIELARRSPTAILCAEAVPWRCHRSLVGDAMLARGHGVLDITGPGKARPHKLTPWAQVRRGRVFYPAG